MLNKVQHSARYCKAGRVSVKPEMRKFAEANEDPKLLSKFQLQWALHGNERNFG